MEGTRRARLWRSTAGVVLVVSIAAAAWWSMQPNSQGVTSAAGSAGSIEPSSASSDLPADRTALFEAALTATDPTTIERALAPAVRTAHERTPFALLPAGSTAAVDGSKLAVSGGAATVPVTVTGGPAAGQWLLLLTSVNGEWLIYGTAKL